MGINEPAGARPATESYVAEVVGNDVFIRSGPGTNFYQCGKLYAGDRVQVISTQQWLVLHRPAAGMLLLGFDAVREHQPGEPDDGHHHR